MPAQKSKGCRNCVKRRIKCDQARPSCERCKKIKVQCDGVPEPVVFIDETTTVSQRSRTAQTAKLDHDCHSQQITDSINKLSLVTRPTSHTHDVHLAFLRHNFLPQPSNGRDTVWTIYCPPKNPLGATGSLALQALATGYFSRRNACQETRSDALKLYGKVLRLLNDDLQDEQRVTSYDVLVATMALNLYEYVMLTSELAWLQHLAGLNRLFELQGPKVCASEPIKTVLDVNRFALLIQSLAARKRSFLEKIEWRHCPWDPTIGNLDLWELYDMFVDLPGLTEDIQNLWYDLNPDKETTVLQHAYLVERMEELVSKLREWKKSWESRNPQNPYEIDSSEVGVMSFDSKGFLFSSVLWYRDLECVDLITTYDAIMISALEWQKTLLDPDWCRGYHHEGVMALEEAQSLAMEVCRSIDYHQQFQNLSTGAFHILFPLKVAYMALPVESREAKWLVKMTSRIADLSGLEIGRSLLQSSPERQWPLGRCRKVKHACEDVWGKNCRTKCHVQTDWRLDFKP